MTSKINDGGAEELTYQIMFTETEMSHLQPALSDRLEQLIDAACNENDSDELQEAIEETSDLLNKINSYSDEEQP